MKIRHTDQSTESENDLAEVLWSVGLITVQGMPNSYLSHLSHVKYFILVKSHGTGWFLLERGA